MESTPAEETEKQNPKPENGQESTPGETPGTKPETGQEITPAERTQESKPKRGKVK